MEATAAGTCRLFPEQNQFCVCRAIQTTICGWRQVLLGSGVTAKFILAAAANTHWFVEGSGIPRSRPQVWGTELEGRHEDANSRSGRLRPERSMKRFERKEFRNRRSDPSQP